MKQSNSTDWQDRARSQGITIGTLSLGTLSQRSSPLPQALPSLSQLFPSFPQLFPSFPQALPSFPQALPSLPQQELSSLPSDAPNSVRKLWLPASRGDNNAQNKIGKYYESIEKPKIGNKKKAAEWYKKAADQGNADAQYNMGRFLECHFIKEPGSNMQKAAGWYQKAADQNHAEAQFCLGRFYERGQGHIKKNIDTAVQYYEKAAKQGHADAQLKLAQYYEDKHKWAEAKEWYQKIAERGNDDHLLDYYRRTGNNEEVKKWHQKKAEALKAKGNNNSNTLLEIGMHYYHANMMPEAQEYYKKSSALGNGLARMALDKISSMQSSTTSIIPAAAAKTEVQSAKRNSSAEKEENSKRYKAASDTETEEEPPTTSFSARVNPIQRGGIAQGSPRR